MRVILLAGGGAKGLSLVMGRDGSRSLLRMPSGRLLDMHLQTLSEYSDDIIVVSDDPLVENTCIESPGCRPVRQAAPGVEGAVCSGLSALASGGLVTVLYADTYYEKGFVETHMSKLLNSYEPIVTVTRPVLLRGHYLRMEVDPVDGRVSATGRGDFVYAGLITFPHELARELLCRKGVDMHSFIEELVRRGLQANIWLGEWLDIDTPWDYLVAVQLTLRRLRESRISTSARIGRGVVLEGPVVVEDGAVVDHYAVVKGPAYIGPRSLVGAHSFVRGSAIYESAVVGAYAEVKRSVVYDAARVGSHSYIADSVLGRASTVAPYTVTLNTPYAGVSSEVVIMTTHPLETLKIGSVIAAGSETSPHTVLKPATIYKG